MTDARRKELYWARYAAAGTRVSGPDVSRPGEIPAGATLPVAGQAATLYPDDLGEPIWRENPSAAVLAELVAERLGGPDGRAAPSGAAGVPDGPGVDLLPPEPLYLRRPDARVPGPPKRVTAP